MNNFEAIVIRGAEQFSSYSGYGFSFEWAGGYEDTSPIVNGYRDTCIVAFDAVPFISMRNTQYWPNYVKRELNKVRIARQKNRELKEILITLYGRQTYSYIISSFASVLCCHKNMAV
jgi:hypothetical protein